MVVVERASVLTGKVRLLDIDISEAEFEAGLSRWLLGGLVQDAFPGMTADEREFWLTGIVPEEWAEMLGEEV